MPRTATQTKEDYEFGQQVRFFTNSLRGFQADGIYVGFDEHSYYIRMSQGNIVATEKQNLLTPKIQFYDPNFGDTKVCDCGHHYYRHFDSYEDWDPVGCKYCNCRVWHEPNPDTDYQVIRLLAIEMHEISNWDLDGVLNAIHIAQETVHEDLRYSDKAERVLCPIFGLERINSVVMHMVKLGKDATIKKVEEYLNQEGEH